MAGVGHEATFARRINAASDRLLPAWEAVVGCATLDFAVLAESTSPVADDYKVEHNTGLVSEHLKQAQQRARRSALLAVRIEARIYTR